MSPATTTPGPRDEVRIPTPLLLPLPRVPRTDAAEGPTVGRPIPIADGPQLPPQRLIVASAVLVPTLHTTGEVARLVPHAPPLTVARRPPVSVCLPWVIQVRVPEVACRVASLPERAPVAFEVIVPEVAGREPLAQLADEAVILVIVNEVAAAVPEATTPTLEADEGGEGVPTGAVPLQTEPPHAPPTPL